MAGERLVHGRRVEADMSDIARVYVSGTEPAKGNQTGGQPEVNGAEKATVKNSSLAHDYKDDRTK